MSSSWALEDHLGKNAGTQNGFNGHMRLAWLQGRDTALPTDPDDCFLKLLSATARKYLRSTDETQERLGLGLEHRRGLGSHPPDIETRQWHFGKDLPKTKSFFRSPAEVAKKLSKRR